MKRGRDRPAARLAEVGVVAKEGTQFECPAAGRPCPDVAALGVLHQTGQLGYVLSGICHELGNPLNSALSAIAALEMKAGSFSVENIRWYLEAARKELERASDILMMLKSLRPAAYPAVCSIPIDQFLKHFAELTRRDFERRGISIDLDVNLECGSILADPGTLHQVLLGAMLNAADAMESDPEPSIWITARRRSAEVEITVRDNGPGFSEEALRNIFVPFFTTKKNSAGLGLYMSRRILSSIGSSITAQNAVPNGAIVHLSFPASGNL